MDVVRITELQPKTYVEQGDYIAIDNQSDGTKKVQFTNLLDDTLSQENKIAPANVVGDEIATIRAAVGSPLKASTVAQMTDTNKIYVYVGSESGYTNGNWYYWNGSAWTSGGVYNSVAVVTDPTLTLSGVPADAKATGDEVTNLKSASFEKSEVIALGDLVNLPFGKENDSYGIKYSTGELISSSLSCTTNYIDITMFKSLTYKRIQVTAIATYGMAFYDANKVYISGERVVVNADAYGYTERSIAIPDDAVYARFTIIKDTDTYGDFSAHGESIIKDTVNKMDNRIDVNSKILSFEDNILLEYAIATTGYGIRYSNGETISSSIVCCTEYIDVSLYAKLAYKRIRATSSATYGMAFYDSTKTYISGQRCLVNAEEFKYNDDLQSIDVPKNAVYARFTTIKDTDTYGEFSVSGESKLHDYVVYEPSPYRKDITWSHYSSEWYKAQGDSYEGFTINTLYSEMITAWDALVANSKGYMTKESIGTASDSQTMYCYKMMPLRFRNNTDASVSNTPPSILIVPSIHGYEKSAAFGTYYFVKDLVYNFDKSPVLNAIRTKCVLYVVPVGNPYGFDNKTRKNANGVDCNRNWGVDPSGITDPTSPYYPGAEPFDQPETQAIKSVIDDTDLFYIIDYHTDGQYKASSWSEVNWITWAYDILNDDYFKMAYNASQFHLSEISENLPLEYNFDTSGSTIGSITLGAQDAPRPTISYYGRTERNIMGGTFEGNNGLPIESDTAYSPMEQKINSELIGNWIKNILITFEGK